ncbi:hypothetical protein [Brevifollis gellanilyticus]|uniref:Uncharacterized protein n=1 Tax=Brevifollis gellanilyticus TaxID=748831 RepID=A0A512MDX8_9BACT|nr:hypothetical protein [Brevifollis gellanilyticus]GEP44934.1 hypothetical protein BGE01nite_42250 [Brevifollis gellanilyticus]
MKTKLVVLSAVLAAAAAHATPGTQYGVPHHKASCACTSGAAASQTAVSTLLGKHSPGIVHGK